MIENSTQEQILKKVRDMETHFCNFLANFQYDNEYEKMQKCIEKFSELSSKPFNIDVSTFVEISDKLKIIMQEFVVQARSFEVSSLVKELRDLTKEIKNINDRIDKMEQFGVKKNIHLDIGLLNGEIIIPRHSGILFEHLRLSLRTKSLLRKCFNMQDDTPISELSKLSEFNLIKIPGFGKKSVKEIKEILSQYGLSLGMHS